MIFSTEVWAYGHALKIHRLVPTPTMDVAIMIGELEAGKSLYFVADSWYSLKYLACGVLRIEADGAENKYFAILPNPVRFTDSLKMISDAFESRGNTAARFYSVRWDRRDMREATLDPNPIDAIELTAKRKRSRTAIVCT